MKVKVVFYSMYGHIYRMAEAIAEGARGVEGAEVELLQVSELVPDEALMCAQMRNFLDQTGGLWAKHALVGKVGSVFTSSATQHGGQETTITSFHTTLLHLGMIIVGLPYTETRQTTIDEISGGSPYGASTIAAGDGSRMPSENELAMARFQGRHVAAIAARLVRT
jgi:NAD(P)H dehydrogenase (quinone)